MLLNGIDSYKRQTRSLHSYRKNGTSRQSPAKVLHMKNRNLHKVFEIIWENQLKMCVLKTNKALRQTAQLPWHARISMCMHRCVCGCCAHMQIRMPNQDISIVCI